VPDFSSCGSSTTSVDGVDVDDLYLGCIRCVVEGAYQRPMVRLDCRVARVDYSSARVVRRVSPFRQFPQTPLPPEPTEGRRGGTKRCCVRSPQRTAVSSATVPFPVLVFRNRPGVDFVEAVGPIRSGSLFIPLHVNAPLAASGTGGIDFAGGPFGTKEYAGSVGAYRRRDLSCLVKMILAC
jgi:hypothetical protein